ncbi:MAG: hypothetical protein E6G92_14800 [Alphaproteobacteria bacterium]|nr:MAG: hypothetical protein E6G92_14800 [Alphaproteobacteria bacterium]
MDDRKEGEGRSETGHPLPHSPEAKIDEVSEHLVREKGRGDDSAEPAQSQSDLVGPDGEAYGLKRDQAAHQDRGQGWIEQDDEGA